MDGDSQVIPDVFEQLESGVIEQVLAEYDIDDVDELDEEVLEEIDVRRPS